jgi:hypothetical protein
MELLFCVYCECVRRLIVLDMMGGGWEFGMGHDYEQEGGWARKKNERMSFVRGALASTP